MLTLLSAAFVALTAYLPSTANRCTMIGKMGLYRPANAPVLVVRPTRDSLSDGWYVASGNGVQRAPTLAERKTEVFGQVMDLIDADGSNAALVKSSGKVVILWWSITPSCAVWLAKPNRQPALGELFVLAKPRPKSAWLNGLPTFDVHHADWVYNQRLENARAPDSAMTVSEYRSFFNALPIKDSLSKESVIDWKRLSDWGNAYPQLARKMPARPLVCIARNAIDRSVNCTNP